MLSYDVRRGLAQVVADWLCERLARGSRGAPCVKDCRWWGGLHHGVRAKSHRLYKKK